MNSDREVEIQRLISQVRKYEAEKDYFKAAQLCSEAAQLSPSDLSLLLWLGWIYFNDRRYQRAIICAREVIAKKDKNTTSAFGLLIFSFAQDGSWDLAGLALEELKKISPEENLKLSSEVVGSFWDYIASRHAGKKFADVVAAYERLPADIANLNAGNVYDIKLIAANAYINLGESLKSVNTLRLAKTELLSRKLDFGPSKLLSGMTFITSIMPARHDLQTFAVKSWRDYGADVVSINCAEEIELLRDLYPTVTFVKAPRDGRKKLGKPYVYLSDMMLALSQTNANVVGVINSDIILRSNDEDFVQSIYHEAQNHLVYGHRFDVKDSSCIADGCSGSLFIDGIDWFMFPRNYALSLSKQSFIFGCPWWDLWLPVLASSVGIQICLAEGPFAYHEEHVQRWESDIFSSLGMQVVEELAACNFSNRATFTARQMAEFAKFCNVIVKGKLDDVRLVGRFADLIKSLLNIEARKIKC